MDNILSDIFYSQIFKIFIVIIMGVGGFLYFEEYKRLGFKGKYALIIGCIFVLIGTLTSGAEMSTSKTVEYLMLKGKPAFSVGKFIFIGYAFIIYGCLSFFKDRIKTKFI